MACHDPGPAAYLVTMNEDKIENGALASRGRRVFRWATIAAGASIAVTIIAVHGRWISPNGAATEPMGSHAAHAHDVTAATQYTCSMHPEVVSSGPGRCPKCGMTLVPKVP